MPDVCAYTPSIAYGSRSRDEEARDAHGRGGVCQRHLIEQIRRDQSLVQAMNVATLPGIVGSSLAMPDIHQGYGFPIGGVAALDVEHGVVSPGGVGFDINCGVRLVRTSLSGAGCASAVEGAGGPDVSGCALRRGRRG